VGAYAIALYITPRFTKDLDILVEPDEENSRRILKALNEFGFKSLKLSEADFSRKNKIIQLGYEPLRVDIMTSIEGCSFKNIWKNKVSSFYGKQKVFFIGIEQMIKNKRTAGREQDKVDLTMLLEAKRKKSRSAK